MSNLKKHFFHISKSWFSVCTFIFLLAVCVGLVIHITNKKENATCSNSEAPIVSNGNVSEESGSDIAHAENYVPTEEDVLVARQQATEGMSQQQVERLTEVIKAANLWLEQRYMDENLFEKLSDPNSLYWNYFHQTGEIQIGWAVDGSIDIDAVCKREKLSLEEFYAKYGTPVVATNFYDADGFIDLLSEMKSSVQNEDLKSDLQDLIDQTKQAKETHRMEIVNDIYKKLHDLDYFLLRYGPIDVAKYVKDDSTVSKYYGTLSFYQ